MKKLKEWWINFGVFLYRLKANLLSFICDIYIVPQPLFLVIWGDHHYKIKGDHQRYILDTLCPGDILLRRFDNYLGTYLIPGYFSHAAIYVGEDKVIHMLGQGICEEDILSFMRCDDIAILRYKDIEMIPAAIENARIQLQKGVEYDYDFKTEEKGYLGKIKFYCTELVQYCYGYPKIYKQIIDSKILPDDLLSSEYNVVWGGRKFPLRNM